MATPKRVLVVEDEADLADLMAYNLGRAGYEAEVVRDGASAVRRATELPPDLLVLDIMLPQMSGLQVARQLRTNPKTSALPIIMVTAKAEELDQVAGLTVGADDYVTKPFSVGELVARVRAVLRRVERANNAPALVRIGKADVNLAGHIATCEGHEEPLSSYEVALLTLLLERVNEAVSRDEILDKVWGVQAINNRAVDNFIVKLRRKVEPSPDKPQHILTVYGHGYKLVL